MDLDRLDTLARSVAAGGSRRRLLGVLAAVPLLGGLADILSPEEAEAKDRRRRRKQRHKTRKDKSQGKRKGKQGCKPKSRATVCAGTCGSVKNRQTCGKRVDCGPCPCTPACGACQSCDTATLTCVATCAADSCCDGGCVDLERDPQHCGTCGNACGAGQVCQDGVCGVACGGDFCPAATEICANGTCQECNVTCSGGAAACGETLRTALGNASLATLYVCAGTYQGRFTIDRDVTIIGAGEGAEPDSNTVLAGTALRGVLQIGSGEVTLQRLHITRGVGASFGGGIWQMDGALTMEEVTVAGNRAREGGGISSAGTLTLTRCTVRNNTAIQEGPGNTGGGLALFGTATLTDCRITDNTAEGFGSGGGLRVGGIAQVTLEGETVVERNTASEGGGISIAVSSSGWLTIGETCRVTDNTATPGSGGGIYWAPGTSGAVTLEGSGAVSPIVVSNCPDNCAGEDVPRCAAEPVSCPA